MIDCYDGEEQVKKTKEIVKDCGIPYRIRDKYDDGTGDYGLHFTNNMGNATYAVTFGLDDDGSSSVVLNADTSNGTMAAGSFDFESYYVNSTNNRTNYDYANIYIVVHGDLA